MAGLEESSEAAQTASVKPKKKRNRKKHGAAVRHHRHNNALQFLLDWKLYSSCDNVTDLAGYNPV